AFRHLRKRLPNLDLAAARSTLEGRYGREAVAGTLMSIYQPSPPTAVAPPAPDQSGTILIVAIDGNRTRVRAFANRMVDTGFDVDLITADAESWEQVRLDERVRLHLVGPAEERQLSQRVRRALVYRTAGAVLDAGRSIARRSRALGPEATVARTQ